MFSSSISLSRFLVPYYQSSPTRFPLICIVSHLLILPNLCTLDSFFLFVFVWFRYFRSFSLDQKSFPWFDRFFYWNCHIFYFIAWSFHFHGYFFKWFMQPPLTNCNCSVVAFGNVIFLHDFYFSCRNPFRLGGLFFCKDDLVITVFASLENSFIFPSQCCHWCHFLFCWFLSLLSLFSCITLSFFIVINFELCL